MRVIPINLDQLQQLRGAGKSFIVVFVGSWQKKQGVALLHQLASCVGSIDLAVFQVEVDVSTPEEEYCVDRQIDLPSVSYVVQGTPVAFSLSTGVASWLQTCLESSIHPAFDNLLVNFGTDGPYVPSHCGRLFISGDRSSVGKSSLCLALLAALIRKGVPPSSLAYIKPVTQCEAEQPVTQFCERVGISTQPGPVIFYKGFTRAYLAGETLAAEAMLAQACLAVDQISHGKTFVLIDGVGYPSVGSICNISNAHVAAALKAPVLLIGKSGVGDAVDSHNLNAAYFENQGVPVLGAIFNKLPLEGYYNLESCRESVSAYFRQYKREQMPYGFMPLMVLPVGEGEGVGAEGAGMEEVEGLGGEEKVREGIAREGGNQLAFTALESALCGAVEQYVEVDRLLHDVWIRNIMGGAFEVGGVGGGVGVGVGKGMGVSLEHSGVRVAAPVSSSGLGYPPSVPMSISQQPQSQKQTQIQSHQQTRVQSQAQSLGATSARKRSRAEVEAEARSQGAQGG